MTGRKIGVYICHCGGNISDHVDVAKVQEAVRDAEGVAVARTMMFSCSDASQEEMIADVKEKGLDGLVVASCSPKLHLYTFRGVARRAGLNPYEYVRSTSGSRTRGRTPMILGPRQKRPSGWCGPGLPRPG
jgi:heterodisulfide reductase subunit A